MTRGRLEAFSDGVLAIIITIMVLELRPPEGRALAELRPLLPVFLSYVLSFIYVGIYWNNHHHLMHTVRSVNGWILWANSHLLFWLSLVPFATAWLGSSGGGEWPAVVYGFVLLMAAVAYTVLVRALLALHGRDSELAQAIGGDFKGKISLVVYVAAIGLAFVDERLAYALYVLVAAMWFIPDRRIESKVRQ
ncbi:MAG: TMEM175 family protein [Myxococcales bacterium]